MPSGAREMSTESGILDVQLLVSGCASLGEM